MNPEVPSPEILSLYSLHPNDCQWEILSGGLINITWKITCRDKSYILQRINTQVFKNPELIAENIDLVSNYLKAFPEYQFVAPVINTTGMSFVTNADGHFRLFPFVEKSYSIEKVATPEQAFEAAAQFGKFTFMLRDFVTRKLNITLPDFHNITLRYKQFLEAIETGNQRRIEQSSTLISDLKGFSGIIDTYERIRKDKDFILRVTHHDTKISNVLYDRNDKGLYVIDLDTVMPGYFISDLGDMMRTYLSPVTEEETDFSKIAIRTDIYEAVISGYLKYMRELLTESEKKHLTYAGPFLIYMQALRFITDYLKDDVYYGARYPEHNFNRAMNQFVLLQKLTEKADVLSAINKKYL